MSNQKIVPFIWFEEDAREAAKLYTSVFGANVHLPVSYEDSPSGETEIIPIEILGVEVILMKAGVHDKLNPAISFMVSCGSSEQVEEFWGKLIVEGKALMEIGEYPFSKKYGWVEDKFGVSWQLMAVDEKNISQKVRPNLLFANVVCGRAEEAARFYVSVFKNSSIQEEAISRYGENPGPDKPESVNFLPFNLDGFEMVVMDSAYEHAFGFNDSISMMVNCDDQAEVDYLWDKLVADGGQESMCGWLKDKFGVSWQITPKRLMELNSDPDREKANRVFQSMLTMKKIVIEDLEKAYRGE